MRTRSWITVMSVALLVTAGIAVGHSALATADPKVDLELRALSPVFPAGGQADLEVLVGSEALGGYANLYAKEDGEAYRVMTFPIHEHAFVIHAPVSDNPDLLGRKLTFQFEAFTPDGCPLGSSKKADGLVVDPDVE